MSEGRESSVRCFAVGEAAACLQLPPSIQGEGQARLLALAQRLRAEGGFVQAESLADQETHVFWPLTDAACVWCSNAETCCPENSWTADRDGPVCP